jgi:hypothetical protein
LEADLARLRRTGPQIEVLETSRRHDRGEFAAPLISGFDRGRVQLRDSVCATSSAPVARSSDSARFDLLAVGGEYLAAIEDDRARDPGRRRVMAACTGSERDRSRGE